MLGSGDYFSMANLGFRSDKCNSGHYLITFQRLILMACLVQETMDSFVGSSLSFFVPALFFAEKATAILVLTQWDSSLSSNA
ncbi:hypothetical protein OIU76_013812 [Salix suchowensis]|nr:hypothetical protein OIU76_013812 [Salix suchowensis]